MTKHPEKGIIHPVSSKRGHSAYMFFDDPDFIGAIADKNKDGEDESMLLNWAVREMSGRAILLSIQDVLVQGNYEYKDAYILKDNHSTEEALNYFARSRESRSQLIGGTVRLTGDAGDILAEIFDDASGAIRAFGFDNGELEIAWHQSWPMSFHDLPTKELSIFETTKGSMSRFVVDQCIAATSRSGLMDNVDYALDEISKYFPALK